MLLESGFLTNLRAFFKKIPNEFLQNPREDTIINGLKTKVECGGQQGTNKFLGI